MQLLTSLPCQTHIISSYSSRDAQCDHITKPLHSFRGVLPVGTKGQIILYINTAKLLCRKYTSPHRHNTLNWNALALLSVELSDFSKSVVTEIRTDHATIHVTVTLCSVQRKGTGVAGNLPDGGCGQREQFMKCFSYLGPEGTLF